MFVFGYRSAKIRSKKISNLIHSSAGRDNINSCTVTVHFCKGLDRVSPLYTQRAIKRYFEGQDLFQPIEKSQFYVSRTAYQDNNSRYSLNGNVDNFKNIG